MTSHRIKCNISSIPSTEVRVGCTHIEKASLNIVLDEEDHDATRFFWLSKLNNPTCAFEIYRFKHILFGASSSTFILNATLDKHLKQFSDPVEERISEDIYADDLVSRAQDGDGAVSFYTKARSWMTPAGFNLRSWTSNNLAVRTIAVKKNLLNDPKPKIPWYAVVYYWWRPSLPQQSDNIRVQATNEAGNVTHIIEDIWPLGFVNQVVLNSNLLMQEIWNRGFQWDELLPTDLKETWERIAKELTLSTHTQLPC